LHNTAAIIKKSVRDFCNTPALFFDRHSETRISCFDVANFLQAGGIAMKSAIAKRSIVIAGHKTSVSLEDAFWTGLKEIAGERNTHLSDLVAAIDSERQHDNLSSAIRLFVFDFYRTKSSEAEERHDRPCEIGDTASLVPATTN
jgi:predicted DNA-binding ribbon-helix-helix protein